MCYVNWDEIEMEKDGGMTEIDRAVSLHPIQISTIFNLMNKLKSIFLYTNFYLLIS